MGEQTLEDVRSWIHTNKSSSYEIEIDLISLSAYSKYLLNWHRANISGQEMSLGLQSKYKWFTRGHHFVFGWTLFAKKMALYHFFTSLNHERPKSHLQIELDYAVDYSEESALLHYHNVRANKDEKQNEKKKKRTAKSFI